LDDSLSQTTAGLDGAFETAVGARADHSTHLLDATMLFAPRSGGVKSYLLAKQAWLRGQQGVRATLVVPGSRTGAGQPGVITIAASRPPFLDGYRLPANRAKWTRIITALAPDLIEAADPYVPGHAVQDAAQALGVPAVGFCHCDPVALASLHFGDWAGAAAQEPWARFYARFDLVLAPSRYIAARLADSGVERIALAPLGVDTGVFRPSAGDRQALRRRLGLKADARLLVFAGRPAREKNLEILVETVARLGDPYRLLLVGAGRDLPPHPGVISLDFERDPHRLARLMAGCDAFIHANDKEAFGLVVLEALACGLPVVAPPSGGVAELVDDEIGRRARSADAAGMAEAIAALFEADLDALSLAARRRAVQRHSWERTFTTLFGRYTKLLGQAAGGPIAPSAERLPLLNYYDA
jgi:alpha-1,6-mannosyltransferase